MSYYQPSLRTTSITTLVLSLLLSNSLLSQDIPTDQATIDAGASLFRQNCTVCHQVKAKVIGPALEGVYDRRDISWILAYVKNSQKVIASGDEYAVNLFNEYNNVEMTSFDFLDDDQILSIIAYIKAEAEKEDVAVIEGGEGLAKGEQSDVASDYLTVVLIGLIVVLALIMVVLVIIVSVLKKFLQQKEGLDEADIDIVKQSINFGVFFKHKATIGVMVFLFTAILLKNTIDGLYAIGVQQGYAPTQPIAFSHKLHAGNFEIDCNYCHTGVRNGKNANIPSVNICMNCHNSIITITGSNVESTEIKKIYAAVENNQPIEWIRVHNLPDLAYFNHSQHVEIGGLECQTCHGPVEEMDIIRQYSLLTMGWCIDCHRKTNVKTKGNEYYDKLVEMHDASEPMKVRDIGGLECAKCHY